MADRQHQQAAPTTAAQTTTQTTINTSSPETPTEAPRILRLRGGHNASERSVQWAEDVVDNEGLGRKSSKVCCIYHKPKAVDESSDESSSDSSSSDSDSDSEGKKKGRGEDGKKTPACDHPRHGHGRGRKKKHGDKQKRPPSPNAYEKVLKPRPKDESGGTQS